MKPVSEAAAGEAMHGIGPKQMEHIAAWQRRIEDALENLTSHLPREQAAGAEVISDFCKRFGIGSPVFEALLGERFEAFEEQLLVMAEGRDKYSASSAMRLLGLIKSKRGYEAALLYLDGENPFLIEPAISLFALSASDDELGRLHHFLKHGSAKLRNAAVKAFAERAYQPALNDLLVMLDELRAKVRDSFGQKDIRGAEARALLKAVAKIQGSEAVPLLLDIAAKDVSIRTYAIKTLQEIDGSEAAPAVVHLLADRSVNLVAEVLRLVSRADFRTAIPLIRPLLKSPDGSIRNQALRILIEWGDSHSEDAVFDVACHDTSPVLRTIAVEGILSLSSGKKEQRISSLLGDLNVQVRSAAVKALNSLPELQAETQMALEHLAQYDEDLYVRGLARNRVHGFSPFLQMKSEAPPKVLLFPAELEDKTSDLAAHLRAWRQYLPELAGNCPVTQIKELDQSLSILIQAIEAAE